MKLNRDNFELMMFDLLEGNLSERDSLEVMKQIEEDEFFFKQWKLFKSTILIADKDVVFEAKDTLMKKEAGAVPMFRWASIAVAASLVLAVFFFWPTTPTVQVAEETPKELIEAPLVPIEQQEVVSTEVPEAIEPEMQVEEVLPIQKVTPVVDEDLFNTNGSNRVIVQELPKKNVEDFDEEIVIPEDPIVIKMPVPKEIIAIDKPKDIVEDVTKERKLELIADVQPLPTSEEEKINFKSLVTSKSRRRIRDRAATLIAAVSNPKVKLKPQFDGLKPGLKIELETNGYQAVASLQPFNKKKN